VKKLLFISLVLTISVPILLGSLQNAEGIIPNPIRPGFDTSILAANDDLSTGLISIGFSTTFFSTDCDDVYVNNNGNITCDSPLGIFTPFPLTSTSRVIIAPFFADVDTRAASSPVKYGTGLVNGRAAFGVTWVDVNCFSAGTSNPAGNNDFQLVLIDRSDVGPGDFDIEFNYNTIKWETGQASGGNSACLEGFSARVGYSDGTAPNSFEFAGSGTNNAFLDSGPASTSLIQNSLNSNNFLGRYIIPVRNGIPQPEPQPEPIIGGKLLEIDSAALLIAGAQTNSYSILTALAFVGAAAFGSLYLKFKRK